jgi:hypothetical protein
MENYAKLFDISWIEPWLVEALATMALALLLAMIISRLIGFLNGDKQ